ncbi:MFS general substrate transporter [Trichodelitschia bisporula]|uniref:MFS general substrate transporter n=1 Tax=Trichodelitschia bisporula TaxID=703511 RepID=A0A6G1HTY8_9PEZI|nr:MFS general substrate transporter [Trichodelitschia bisporula]
MREKTRPSSTPSQLPLHTPPPTASPPLTRSRWRPWNRFPPSPQQTLTSQAAEAALLRKCDWHVIPMLGWLYFVMSTDRLNIGNARLAGLEADLHMKGSHDFALALIIPLLAQTAFALPSILALKRVRPSRWLAGLAFGWGLATLGTGFARTHPQLLACRFLLGFFEAGFLPGLLLVCSAYYARFELQKRLSLIFAFTVLAGALSGLLAYACAKLGNRGNLAPWRWIFVLEGAGTLLSALLAFFTLPDLPADATFLSEGEKRTLGRRLRADGQDARMDTLDSRALRLILKDWKLYTAAFMAIPLAAAGYGIVFFAPTILAAEGYVGERAHVHSIPIYVVAFALVLASAWASDRAKHRAGFVLAGVGVGVAGYGVLLADTGAGARYAALFLAAAGFYTAQPLVYAWVLNNQCGHWKRAVAAGVLAGCGNAGGILAALVFPRSSGPRFTAGFAVMLGCLGVVGLVAGGFWWGLRRENQVRERGGRNGRLRRRDSEVENLGDAHPAFRFSY